jgi:hypothetical protein
VLRVGRTQEAAYGETILRPQYDVPHSSPDESTCFSSVCHDNHFDQSNRHTEGTLKHPPIQGMGIARYRFKL